MLLSFQGFISWVKKLGLHLTPRYFNFLFLTYLLKSIPPSLFLPQIKFPIFIIRFILALIPILLGQHLFI